MYKRMVENSVPKRHYTAKFKTEAVSLAQSVGLYQAVRLLGVPVATLGNWTRRQCTLEATSVNGAMPATPAKRPASQMNAEITRLRKELAGAKPISRFFESAGVVRERAAVKYPWTDTYRDYNSVSRLCRMLGVSGSAYCQQRSRAPSARSQASGAQRSESTL